MSTMTRFGCFSSRRPRRCAIMFMCGGASAKAEGAPTRRTTCSFGRVRDVACDTAQIHPVKMTDGNRERIGGVERRRGLAEAEQQLNHRLHLPFLRAAVSDDRLFYFGRRVL